MPARLSVWVCPGVPTNCGASSILPTSRMSAAATAEAAAAAVDQL